MDTKDIVLISLGSVYTAPGSDLKLASSDANLLGVDVEPLPFFISKIRKLGFKALNILEESLLPESGRVCVCALQSAGPQFKPKFCHFPALQIRASDKLLGLCELCFLFWK